MGKIYTLKLHDIDRLTTPSLPTEVKILRVAGGWIYLFYEQVKDSFGNYEWQLLSTEFIPFANEFQSG